ncbi:MAG: (d)CMP kinase [Candidatus Omnitrophota bacterium]|nr:MAG: (d)CMP kinase [Candidatus Omnitrophota bacterium]
MIIAIDGPAGAGKSTVARLLAQRLGFLYIDTGAMYRALTLKAIETNLNINDEKVIIEMACDTSIDLTNNSDGTIEVFLDGRNVSKEIREPKITKLVSDIAKIKGVRERMLEIQRRSGRQGDSVLEGRDIATVVFPDAEKKFYIDADFKERTKRRYLELRESEKQITTAMVAEDLRNRDFIDSSREFAPLKKAEDAVYIDTTDMSIEEVVEVLLKHIKN